MIKIKIDYTYEVLIPGSAELENGEASERGWGYCRGNMLETDGQEYNENNSEIIEVNSINELHSFIADRLGYFFVNDKNQFEETFSQIDPDQDLFDGSETYFSAHTTIIKE